MHDAENAKLKARIEELEKNNTKENAELRDRVTKVEQNQLQNDSKGNNTLTITHLTSIWVQTRVRYANAPTMKSHRRRKRWIISWMRRIRKRW